VADRLRGVAAGYCNLELDLDTGSRGERGQFVERALAVLCEAEAATVVNNCAAALVLVLRLLTRGEKKEVIVSRGELVEIGGGFRVPEILQSGGVVLREVGTTNRTSLADYEQAIGSKTAMILKVHRSNFFIDGFTQEPDVAELVTLVHQHGLPIVEDLGSGAVAATEQLNADLEHEPTPAEALRHGIDLVCVSGDKLFGGPQAGIIAGKADWILKLKKDAIFRALRCDKLILAALEQTAVEYFNQDVGRSTLPVPRMLALATGDLRGRAERIVAALKVPASIGSGKSRCGGGTMPRSALDSITIDLRPEGMSVDEFGARLRHGRPPVIGYVSEGIFKIDLRTVFPWQDEALIAGIEAAAR
jgi:L-seryl-tRNA(Ser) seleniumtransferase